MYTYNCKLIRVVDGDTIWVRVDLGFRLYHDIDLRLAGINAPEMKTPEGPLSKQALIDFLGTDPTLVVETAQDPGSYGRYTAKVYLGDTYVNDWLVKNNWAVPYVYKWG